MKNKIIRVTNFMVTEMRILQILFFNYLGRNFSKQSWLRHHAGYHGNLWKF